MLQLCIDVKDFSVYNIIHNAETTSLNWPINLIAYMVFLEFIWMRGDKKCKLQGQKEKVFYIKNVKKRRFY